MLLATVKPRHKNKTLAVLTLDIGNQKDPEGVNRKQQKTVKAVNDTVYQPLSLVSTVLYSFCLWSCGGFSPFTVIDSALPPLLLHSPAVPRSHDASLCPARWRSHRRNMPALVLTSGYNRLPSYR